MEDISLAVTGLTLEIDCLLQRSSMTRASYWTCRKYSPSKDAFDAGVAKSLKCDEKPAAISSAPERVFPSYLRVSVAVDGLAR